MAYIHERRRQMMWVWIAAGAIVALLIITAALLTPRSAEVASPEATPPAETAPPATTPVPQPTPESPPVAPAPESPTGAPAPAPERERIIRERERVIERQPVIIERDSGESPTAQPTPPAQTTPPQPAPRQGVPPTQGEPGTPGAPTTEENYQGTGLPEVLTFQNRAWQAVGMPFLPEEGARYRNLGRTESGRTVYVPSGEPQPYDRIYMRVPGREEYVAYEPVE